MGSDGVTYKADAITSPPLGFPDGLLTPSRVNPKKSVLARQGVTPSGQGVTPSPSRIQQSLALCRILHFYAPKTSKMTHFPDFFSKTPILTKGTI